MASPINKIVDEEVASTELNLDPDEVISRLDKREYTASVHALAQFVLPVVVVFSIFMIFTVGKPLLTSNAVFPLITLYLAAFFSLFEYFDKRNLDVSEIETAPLLRRLIMAGLVRGISCGLLIVLSFPHIEPHAQAAALMLVVLIMTISLTSASAPLLLAFGLPPGLIVALGTNYYNAISGWQAISLLGFTAFLVISGAIRARKNRIENMEQIMESELIELQRVDAERKMLAYEAETVRKELLQQEANRKMQEELIAGLTFPVVVSEGNDVLMATPECRRQFNFGDLAASELQLSQFFVDPTDQQHTIKLLDQYGKVDGLEILMKDMDGKQFWVSVSLRPINYDNKDCWIISIFNLDTRKRMEQELSTAKESAEEALDQLKSTQQSLIHAEKMASLGQLTAGIAHEIKNPLNFVNNFSKLSAELLDELVELIEEPIKSLGEEEREDAEDLVATVRENLLKIDEHGKRADSIVKNMLDHSREGGEEKVKVDINSLSEEALNLAYHGARASDKSFNIELELDLAEDAGSVMGLPQELQRVILNLCSNGMYEAVKYSKSNDSSAKLTLRTRLENSDVYIDVEDNGGGVPQEIKDKIFQPFFTTKPTGEGTGLGLSMSYDIIKEHGGELSLLDARDGGSIFQIRIPK